MNTKKIFSVFLAVAFVLCAFGFADAAMRHFEADVNKLINTKTVPQKISDTITYKVLVAGSNTSETIYSDEQKTAMTNPVTTTVFAAKDRIDFWCDPTASDDLSVDIIVTDTNGGFSAVIKNFTPSMRIVEIDERPNIMHHGLIWFGTSSNVATSTGVTFLPYTAIYDVLVEVVTADSGMTLNVGSSTTAAGFRTGVSMTTAGFVQDTGVITAGSTLDYYPATNYGSLLTTAITGSDAVASGGGNSRKPHFVTSTASNLYDVNLYYTGSSGSDTAAGFIHWMMMNVR